MLKSYHFASTGLKYIIKINLFLIFNMATKPFRIIYVVCIIFLLDDMALKQGLANVFCQGPDSDSCELCGRQTGSLLKIRNFIRPRSL